MDTLTESMTRMWTWPFSAFAAGIDAMARSMEGFQRLAQDGVGVLARPAASCCAVPSRSETKETAMSNRDWKSANTCDRCGSDPCCCHRDHDDDDEVRLYEYSIVSVERGEPRLLFSGQRIVDDCMTDGDFANWVIADYLRGAAGAKVSDRQTRYLRVYSKQLDCWRKPSLHFRDRQIAALERIADRP